MYNYCSRYQILSREMALVLYEESILTKIHQKSHIFPFNGMITQEIIIGQDGRGTGGILWPAAELFCQYFNQPNHSLNLNQYLPSLSSDETDLNPWLWDNKLVLEFGSGLGLTSILLTHLGAKVIATDGEETVVDQLGKNLDLNLPNNLRNNCQSFVYRWGDCYEAITEVITQLPSWTTSSDPYLFDIILATDVVYGEDLEIWSLLEQSIETAVTSKNEDSGDISIPHHPLILIAQTERYPEREALFFQRLQDRFHLRDRIDISGLVTSAATSINGERTYSKCTLYIFTPKKL